MHEPAYIKHSSPGIVGRWRARVSESRRQRWLSVRGRQRLAASIRRAVTASPRPSRHAVLLQDRVGLVSDQLLDLARRLEYDRDLDAAWIGAVHRLFTDGCESPLYNRDVHISELRATLYYLLQAQNAESFI